MEFAGWMCSSSCMRERGTPMAFSYCDRDCEGVGDSGVEAGHLVANQHINQSLDCGLNSHSHSYNNDDNTTTTTTTTTTTSCEW